ncbi:hypothetical protein P4H83_18105 [Paenibacillus favisporus]|uniref:hypothetical protein n=1 Tax=Paenibacillus favisporus TaxID=221028 RepID=UPI002DBAE375|nr:hypothetical protein [Paenibacillus favisporus]MEC0176791.1 hypothetical protein [Paenibacillus favisporus]
MSIDSMRERVADGLKVLLMNDSVWQGFALNAVIGIVLIACGWALTYKRAHKASGYGDKKRSGINQ